MPKARWDENDPATPTSEQDKHLDEHKHCAYSDKVLMTLLNSLRKAGLSVEAVRDAPATTGVRVDAVVDVEGCSFVVEERGRVPYPSELDKLEVLRARLAEVGTPLLVVPFVSDGVGDSLRRAGWSWADDAGNYDLRAAGLVLRQRTTNISPPVKSTALPQGSGSLAIIRSLIGFSEDETEEASATTLAAQANVSQPRASQVLSQLHRYGLVTRTGHGRWLPDRAALLDRFLSEYKGPGGSERYLYSLDPSTEVAVSLATVAPAGSVAVSADVGPDLIRAWRRPTMLIVYVRDAIVPWTSQRAGRCARPRRRQRHRSISARHVGVPATPTGGRRARSRGAAR